MQIVFGETVTERTRSECRDPELNAYILDCLACYNTEDECSQEASS
jgi:hypothetical protein